MLVETPQDGKDQSPSAASWSALVFLQQRLDDLFHGAADHFVERIQCQVDPMVGDAA